jgi:hypothetical protein
LAVSLPLYSIGGVALCFATNKIHFLFESATCIKGHYPVCWDHDILACSWISSSTEGLISHGKFAKVGNGNWVPLLKGSLEEFKNPIQEHGRLFFWDPHLPSDSLDNIQLSHPVSFPLWQELNIEFLRLIQKGAAFLSKSQAFRWGPLNHA